MLVFGSLRKNSKRGYNFDRFGGGSQKYLNDIELDGFEMYDLGAYPGICHGTGKIKCELHLVKDEPFTFIQRMEKGAGYHEEQIKLNNDIVATIFMKHKDYFIQNKFPQVKNGDWN
jgi:gamma-glutamylcyclotransferase (GGCT)/AIG2-like uncharacterized protein YtfP